mmetsp:Transcript_18780/g.40668  ORF Transcript_18780/g.40668 Transcript_18780/m.40668 type:complete len:504 (-) Transcript_18780:209-1720(-)
MAPFLDIARFLSVSFVAPRSPRHYSSHQQQRDDVLLKAAPIQSHDISPLSAATTSSCGRSSLQQDVIDFAESRHTSPKTSLSDLATLLGADPTDLLYLSVNDDGERGAYVSRSVKAGDVILRIPLSSCITDAAPPSWFADSEEESDWAARLAASMLDIRLHGTSAYPASVGQGLSLWLSLLPNEKLLRASLPVHWSEETIASAKCTALEVAADSAYFARAGGIADIVSQLQETHYLAGVFETEDLEAMAHDALDLVQTRSCQVDSADGVQWGPPLHVIAPIFDFINHGSSSHNGGCDGFSCANAKYRLERGGIGGEAMLVVRATRTIESCEEVLMDYGVHASPAWRCLNDYGFVPSYDKDDEGDTVADEAVAEVFIAGSRYEVGPSTVPVEMVEAAVIAIAEERRAATSDQSTSNVFEYSDFEPDASLLTPDVAFPIAKRLSEVAFQLILEPGVQKEEEYDDETLSVEDVLGAKLAARLRWSQFGVLLSCAAALREYASEGFE